MSFVLPADGHVHSEWSWDTTSGSMERTCSRAVELGLSVVAFTEHADFSGWAVLASDLADYPHLKAFVNESRAPDDPVGGTLQPPPLDVDGYLSSVQRCRDLFPDLRIMTGVELGEPHRHRDAFSRLLAAERFERVIGSLHCLPDGVGFSEMPNLFRQRPPADVIYDYLDELVHLIEGSDAFGVLGHIDYALRYWPKTAARFEVDTFEPEFRRVLRALADSGRVLEVNTRGELRPELIRWWRDEGGEAVAFGSDAHQATGIARGFTEAAAMVEAEGFRPARKPHDFWRRSR